jgi:hypothetical protein
MSFIQVTNKKICKYYEDNPSINFENINIIFIELFEKLSLHNNNNNNDMKTCLKIDDQQFITNNINEENIILSNSQPKIITELTEILNKFQENSTIQKHNDKYLLSILNKIYNSGELHISSKPIINGMIVLRRQGKPNVIIENRDIETNISSDEVQSFILAIEDQNCNGIFFSQNSGISTKKNYQIEIHNNNIIVFVHKSEYNPSRIEAAVDIIDQLSNKMRQFKNSGGDDCSIPKDIMDSINNEYQLFISQKTAVIDVFKESQKKVLSQIDEIRFPTLDKFLSTKYSAPIKKPGLKCDLCKSFTANNLKALAAHKRGCIRKSGKPTVSPETQGTYGSP